MILEGIVTTLSPTGLLNVAPMGPDVEMPPRRLVLRPFPGSTTLHNLRAAGEGVLHVTDDVLLLARAALGPVDPPVRPATRVAGRVLVDACRFWEFRVIAIDDSGTRARVESEVVHAESIRDFFGFNRAMHAVLEAAILATRAQLLPPGEIRAEFARLAILVEKTGGPREREAFAFLSAHVDREREQRP